jgi:putative flippase GtrA
VVQVGHHPMIRLLTFYWNKQFLSFLLVGALAAMANFGSRFAFENYFGFVGSLIAAFGVGLATAFVLNRIFVFPASGKGIRREFALFTMFNIFAFPVVVGGSFAFHHYFFSNFVSETTSKALSHGIAVILPSFVTFAAQKLYTFSRA